VPQKKRKRGYFQVEMHKRGVKKWAHQDSNLEPTGPGRESYSAMKLMKQLPELFHPGQEDPSCFLGT